MRDYFEKRVQKKKLLNVFRIAGIYYETTWNKEKVKRFPKILDCRVKEDKTVLVFRLPHGVDPKELLKKEYVFRSMFGDLLEFKGHNPVSLTIYKSVHYGTYDYSFDELKQVMKSHKLPIIAGKDINGNFYCYDMTTNPHLLIAGETGSGKSVMLRSIITSLVQHFRTGGLQLYLADLKRSEFHLFRNVDIVEAVMTDKKDVKKCVAWFHKQLTKRGDLLDQHELSHVDELEKKVDYLVLCIDEFSILREEKDTMNQLIDLTALGRALGIYVILSTQRPDRKVIDGLMKANLTVRYAFRHADKTNSRITLGEGAKADASQIDEEDKGKFFMRYSGFKYLQSPKLETEEAKKLLEPYKTRETVKPHTEESGEDILEGEFRTVDEEEPVQFIELLEENENE